MTPTPLDDRANAPTAAPSDEIRLQNGEAIARALMHPELRIVSDELWNAAHGRMAAAKTVYRNDPSDPDRNTGNRLGSGLESRYLLAGFLVCGLCQRTLIVNTHSQRNGKRTSFICSGRRTVGRHACENKYGVDVGQLTDAVLVQLRDALLNPTAVSELLQRELDRQKTAPDELASEQSTLEASVAKLDDELRRLVELAATGASEIPATVAAMQAKQGQRDATAARLVTVKELARKRQDFDVVAWMGAMHDLLNDVKATLETDPREGRQTLRRLLVKPITITPTIEAGVVSFAFTGEAAWDLREPWDIREPYEVYEFYDRESWIAWAQLEAGKSSAERRTQSKWMEVRHIRGTVTRSHAVVRTHSLRAVSSTSTPSPGPSRARM